MLFRAELLISGKTTFKVVLLSDSLQTFKSTELLNQQIVGVLLHWEFRWSGTALNSAKGERRGRY